MDNQKIQEFRIYTDGGARGNPGPAGIGVVIEGYDHSGLLIKKEFKEFIGEATNNEAEYKAVIFALRKLKQLIGRAKSKMAKLKIYVDSELLAKQLNGKYKIKDKNLQPLFLEIWNLKQDFNEVAIENIPREKNKGADKLVNQVLNQKLSSLNL